MIDQIKNSYSVDVYGMHLKLFKAGNKVSILSQKEMNCASDTMLALHSHFTYEVFFVTSGSLALITENNSILFEKRVVVIPPWLDHYSSPSDNESFCLLLSFEKRKSKNINMTSKIENMMDAGICDFPISEEMSFYIRRFSEKCEKQDAASEQACTLLLSLIFNELLSYFMEDNTKFYASSPAETHIYKIETYINGHLGQKITLEEVSKNTNLSIRHVNRMIKNEYGCTFTELVTKKRLAIAKMLLRNTDLKIHSIAEQVYPGSENSFYTLFKKRYGISPLKYRQKHRDAKEKEN